jgi:hypothetical protein
MGGSLDTPGGGSTQSVTVRNLFRYIKGDFDHSSWQTSFMAKNPPREKLADCDPELAAQWPSEINLDRVISDNNCFG